MHDMHKSNPHIVPIITPIKPKRNVKSKHQIDYKYYEFGALT